MKRRRLVDCLNESLRTYPVVAITGPRQSGKTTFLQEQLKGYSYISLEDPDIRTIASTDPRAFLEQYGSFVIFDEVQHVPSLFSFIQTKVDRDKIMGQYILSGSQNFNLMHNITQSLAGRVSILRLMPFDLEEMKGADWLQDDLSAVMTAGFYPAIFERGINPDKFYSNYIQTYINRDVSQLKNIQNKNTFQNFMKLVAARAGQLVNYNDLSRDAGVSHTTIRDWINILETSYIVYTLGPYYRNYSKRVMKSPKLYFHDVGLLCHLLEIRKGKLTPLHPMYGNIFENFIVSEYHKMNYHNDLLREYYFWQDSNKNEIDLLYSENAKMYLTEIKSSTTIRNEFFKNLEKFARISTDEIAEKKLVYGGLSDQMRTEFKVKSWNSIDE